MCAQIVNSQLENNPVIVIGMHRSGTTMMVNVLEKLGVFMGRDQEVNAESKIFIKMNNWLMMQASSSWDDPVSLSKLEADPKLHKLIMDYLLFFVSSIRVLQYVPLTRYLDYKKNKFMWGWKDPRNTFTIDFWLRLYPNAKVILVERDGLAVARSLMKRRQLYLERSAQRFSWIKYLHLFRFSREPFGSSSNIDTTENSIKLWSKYLLRGREVAKKLENRCLVIRYEEFLSEPNKGLDDISSFLEIVNHRDNAIFYKDIIDQLDTSRSEYSANGSDGLSPHAVELLAQY